MVIFVLILKAKFFEKKIFEIREFIF